MTEVIRVGLIDGDADIRFGRRLVIDSQADMAVVFEDEDALSVLKRATEALIDILVIDHRLKSIDGITLLGQLIPKYIEVNGSIPPIILTGPYFSDELQLASILAGATDLVTQDAGPEQLLKAIRSSQAKDNVPDFSQLKVFLDTLPELPPAPIGFHYKLADLDDKQKAVLELFARGKTDKEISIELSMAQYRVRKTIEQMLSELGLATRSQLFAAVYPSSLS
jgi:DNA-binding NarL/FixJ family response regulator